VRYSSFVGVQAWCRVGLPPFSPRGVPSALFLNERFFESQPIALLLGFASLPGAFPAILAGCGGRTVNPGPAPRPVCDRRTGSKVN